MSSVQSDKFHVYTKKTIKSLFGDATKVVVTSDALHQLTSLVRTLVDFLATSTYEVMVNPEFHKKPKMTMSEHDLRFAIIDVFPRGSLVKELVDSKPADTLIFRPTMMNRFVDTILQKLRPDQLTKDGKYKKVSKTKHVIPLFRHVAETIVAYICLQVRDDIMQMKTPRLKTQHLIKACTENQQLSELLCSIEFTFTLKK